MAPSLRASEQIRLGLEPVESREGAYRYACGAGSFAIFRSIGAVGERAIFFHDGEGNVIGFGQYVMRD